MAKTPRASGPSREIATTHTIGAKPYSMAQMRAMAQESRRKSDLRARHLPAASAVTCDPATGVTITMQDGCRVFIPLAEFHELQGATAAELRDVVLRFDGGLLEWPQLDMQFGIAELLTELFGFRFLLAEELDRREGRSRSDAEATASRASGAKGGRPRRKPVKT